MKWLPRSMAGQLLALLLLAMAVTHLIAVVMLSQSRTAEQVHPLSSREIEVRVAGVYRAVASRPAEAEALIADLSLPESFFELTTHQPDDTSAMDEQEAALARSLRHRLNLPSDRPVRVRLRQVGSMVLDGEAVGIPLRDPEAWMLDVEVGLPEGVLLHSRHWPAMMHGHWSRVLSFSIPVGLLPIILIAIFFGRRIIRPLKALSEAAKRVSRGEQVARIRPEGPSDMREVTEAFNDMQERLVRFVDDRTRMIAAIGHDLRTPLTSLRIRAELIDDDELREAMILTLDEMSVMAEETLQFAQDDAAREPTQDVDLVELVGEVINRQRMLGQQVDWMAPSSIRYRCRPVHLKRALGNLIDNATRYGNASVRVITCPSGKELRIEVDDDGPGIPVEQIEQAFEPFMRLDATRNLETGGTGLGLAIARSCIRAHGGEVSLQNRPEGGLRAIISLPL